MLSPVLLAGRQRRGGAEAQRGQLPQLALVVALTQLPQLALTQLLQLALAHCGAAGDGSAEGVGYYRESHAGDSDITVASVELEAGDQLLQRRRTGKPVELDVRPGGVKEAGVLAEAAEPLVELLLGVVEALGGV